MNLRWNLKLLIRKLGYDIVPYGMTPEISRRMMFLNGFKINLILDVGANEGLFALNMIKLRYIERIVSFEPLSSAYSVLSKNAQNNPNWEVANIALGDENKDSRI
jgi:predicted RNA methylase